MSDFEPYESMDKALDALINDISIRSFCVGVTDRFSNSIDSGFIETHINITTNSLLSWNVKIEYYKNCITYLWVEIRYVIDRTTNCHKYDLYTYQCTPFGNLLDKLEQLLFNLEDKLGEGVGDDLWDQLHQSKMS